MPMGHITYIVISDDCHMGAYISPMMHNLRAYIWTAKLNYDYAMHGCLLAGAHLEVQVE